jgi:hypothetical protein
MMWNKHKLINTRVILFPFNPVNDPGGCLAEKYLVVTDGAYMLCRKLISRSSPGVSVDKPGVFTSEKIRRAGKVLVREP